MQKYRTNATSEARIEYGTELVEGLQFFAETAHLAPPVATQNEQLDAARTMREKKERELIPFRARMRFADFNWDTTLRAVARTIEIREGGRSGPLQKVLFPEGVSAVVAPAGNGQLPVARTFLERFIATKSPAAEALRTEWLPKVELALKGLENACKSREGAYAALASARAVEAAAQDDHELLIDKLIGEVRAVFPMDRRKWAVVFPKPSSRSTAAEPAAAELVEADSLAGSQVP